MRRAASSRSRGGLDQFPRASSCAGAWPAGASRLNFAIRSSRPPATADAALLTAISCGGFALNGLRDRDLRLGCSPMPGLEDRAEAPSRPSVAQAATAAGASPDPQDPAHPPLSPDQSRPCRRYRLLRFRRRSRGTGAVQPVPDIPITQANNAKAVGSMRDHRPAAAHPVAPSAQPMTRPMTTGKTCKTWRFAAATSAASPPTRTALRPSINRVTFVVITAVVGVFSSAICASAFCTAIAATPHMPATIAKRRPDHSTDPP